MFWKKKQKKTPEYRFHDFAEQDSTWVEITSGEFNGIVVTYGTVKFVEEGELGRLAFSYDILHSGEHDVDVLKSNEEFTTILGDILTKIIIENESVRTNNP